MCLNTFAVFFSLSRLVVISLVVSCCTHLQGTDHVTSYVTITKILTRKNVSIAFVIYLCIDLPIKDT